MSSSCVIAARPRGSRWRSFLVIPTTRSRCFFGYGRQRTGRVGTPPSDLAKEFNVLPAPHVRCAMVRRRARNRQDRRPLHPGADPGTPSDGGPQPGTRGHARGIPRQAGIRGRDGRTAATDADDHPRVGIQQLQVGHVDRPDVVHGLQRLPHRVRLGEQHPGRREGPGLRRAGDALDSRRPLLRRRSRQPGDLSPAGAVHAVRERSVRARLPRRRDDAQRRGTERYGLQPLCRYAVLLEQLPLQGAAIQLPSLSGLEHAEPLSDAQS